MRPIKAAKKFKERVSGLLSPSAVCSDGRPVLNNTLTLLVETASLLTCGSLSTVDTAAVGVVTDPVDLGVCLDDGVVGVNEDDLIPLVLSVCSYPVGVKDLKVGVSLLCPLLCHSLEGLSNSDSEDSLSLSSPSCLDLPLLEGSLSDPSPDDDISLLCLVTGISGPVKPGGLLNADEVLLSPPVDSPLLVEVFQVVGGGYLPCVSNVRIHALSPDTGLLLCLIGHINHLYGFAFRYISDGTFVP